MSDIETLARQTNFEWGIAKRVLWIRDRENGGTPLVDNAENVLQYINLHVPVKDFMVAYTDSTGIWNGIWLRLDLLNMREPGDNRLFKDCVTYGCSSLEELLDKLI